MIKKLTLTAKQMLSEDNYDIVKIIYLYRYLSWLITSIFYVISGPRAPLIYKISVSLSLLIAAKLITNLYIKNMKNKKILKYYIFVETIGITVLLIPTGGITSPFIWYALNPVLVAASFLPFIFSWMNLFFYITSALLTSYGIFNNEKITFFELLRNNSNSVLVLLLITLVVEMLSALTKQLNTKTTELEYKGQELTEVNKMLEKAKVGLEDNLENVMSLYQVVETFCNQENLKNFTNTFTEYAVKLTKAKSAFFWMAPFEDKTSIMSASNIGISYDIFYNKIEQLWSEPSGFMQLSKIKLAESDYLISIVKSQSRCFGLIGVGVDNSSCLDNEKDYIQKLNFLAKLSSVILERFYFEEIANNLLVVDEQNRIANEIHDSVSQRIFSMTCAIHSIKSRWRGLTEEQIEEEFKIINETAKNAMKDLRFAIYGLSYKKRGEKIFETNIKSYIYDISKLNNINIDLILEGDVDNLSSELKKTLHRIIYEAVGNAVRHGLCKSLYISLIINENIIKLSIVDNGIGFESICFNNSIGLGIYNMKKMVQAVNGKLDLISNKTDGTKLYIKIPITTFIKKEEGATFEDCNCR